MYRTIKLVPFCREYLDKSFVWCNDPMIQKLIDGVTFTKDEQEKWFQSLPTRTDYKIWGISFDNVPIGACGLKGLTEKTGTYWGYIGEKEYWGGLGIQLVSLIEGKAKELSLKRIYICVLHDNQRSIHLHEKLNFVRLKEDEKFIYYYKDIE